MCLRLASSRTRRQDMPRVHVCMSLRARALRPTSARCTVADTPDTVGARRRKVHTGSFVACSPLCYDTGSAAVRLRYARGRVVKRGLDRACYAADAQQDKDGDNEIEIMHGDYLLL